MVIAVFTEQKREDLQSGRVADRPSGKKSGPGYQSALKIKKM
jgi:hypothetical protein